jgi:hypothetical protein
MSTLYFLYGNFLFNQLAKQKREERKTEGRESDEKKGKAKI